MPPRRKLLLSVLLIVGFGIGMVWLAVAIVRSGWHAAVANPTIAIAAISAIATVFTATVTVMLGRYFERKKEIEAHFRADKIKIYDAFLSEFFSTFQSAGEGKEDTDLVDFFREWQRKVVLWGGSEVLRAYIKWMAHLKNGKPDAQTVFLMDEFFR